ncbi:MAG TPA: DUF3306 domain-containing protein [Burkholderiaceae bacterium]|nr:DUF3306 domain-containing protein [Burkholderiaceae bacterium]
MSSEPESFLARWSRRKREAEREAERPASAAAAERPMASAAAPGNEGTAKVATLQAPTAAREPAAPPEVPLPPIDSLDGLRSDYQAFFQQPVDDELRRAALKKLFADPHFNQMDMLDVYVDDYTQFEPLPAALRLRLPSARGFLLDSEREALDAAETPGAAGGARETETAAACEVGDLAAPAAGQVEDRPAAGSTSDETYPEPTPASKARAEVAAADPSGEAKPTSSPAVSPGNAPVSDSTPS